MTAVDDGTNGGWDLVARRLQRELDERGVVPNHIYAQVKVDAKTLQRALEGKPLRRDVQERLASFFGWQTNAFVLIRRGQEPVPVDGAGDDARLASIESDVAEIRSSVTDLRSDLDRVLRQLEGGR